MRPVKEKKLRWSEVSEIGQLSGSSSPFGAVEIS